MVAVGRAIFYYCHKGISQKSEFLIFLIIFTQPLSNQFLERISNESLFNIDH